jgi:tryptophan 2,3-dioxygenase
MEITSEISERIVLLKDKCSQMGQDMNSYLDGLLLSNYITYWDYVRLDTLLSLQQPLTDFPDEQVFIMYHQITELYFKLCLHETDQIVHNGRNVLENGDDRGWNDQLDPDFFLARLKRLNNYFKALTSSFEIMIQGMEPNQFLKFRMALLPASGFQSAQYRKIEITSTDFINLVHHDKREAYTTDSNNSRIEDMFEDSYWKSGATELKTGKKTLTLKQFEKKYHTELISLGKEYQTKNIWRKFKELSESDQERDDIRKELKYFDANVNINWPLVHYKSAVRYLSKDSTDIAATGGTNWQKYLPPKFQKRVFYPELWKENEIEEWGLAFLEKE